MATFPTVKYSWRDLSEQPASVVLRTEMDRGLPKQRRMNSDALVTLELKLVFDTQAEALGFETWFYTDIKAGQDFFDFTPPRGGPAVLARVVGGKLGPLSFSQRTLQASERSLQVEYLRPAY